jgi:hypothetical protein
MKTDIRTIKRNDLRELLNGQNCRSGHMLKVSWMRLRDKTIKGPDGKKMVVEPAGAMITRRLVLRSDWTLPTPSRNFIPAGGIMFNVESQEKAREIRATNDLYLMMSLEGVCHPFGEKDHPVNVPLAAVSQIEDTHAGVTYDVED